MKVKAQFCFYLSGVSEKTYTFRSLKECREYFSDTWEELSRFGGAEADPDCGIPGALVWLDENTERYPDKQLYLGPRGAVRMGRC